MVEILCDTSFVIHLATSRVKNIDSLDTEIGSIRLVVPDVVVTELKILSKDPLKRKKAAAALDFVKNKKILNIRGRFADREILQHVRSNGGIVATLDKKLKVRVKDSGGSVLSLHNDRIVLEP